MKDTASFGGQRDKAELQTPPGSWEARCCPPLHAQMKFTVHESKAASTDSASFLQHSVPSCPCPAPGEFPHPISEGVWEEEEPGEKITWGDGRNTRMQTGTTALTLLPCGCTGSGRGKGQYRDLQGVTDPQDDRLVTYPRAAKRGASPQLLTPLTAAPSPVTPQGPPYSRHSQTINGYRGRHGHISSPWPCSQALCSHCHRCVSPLPDQRTHSICSTCITCSSCGTCYPAHHRHGGCGH